MDQVFLVQVLGFLGLRLRYWVIIVIVILVLIAVAYYARGRSTV